MNYDAWLDRHPTISVLTPVVISSNEKFKVGDEYRTALEEWESEMTNFVWSMISFNRSGEYIRRYLLTVAHPHIEHVCVYYTSSDMGYPRALAVSYSYRGRYHRRQVFHIPS